MATIAENMAAIIERKWSDRDQVEIAAEIGVSAQRLSDWLAGKYPDPRVRTLLKMAKGLKSTVGELVSGLDPAYENLLLELAREELPRDPLRHEPNVSSTPSSNNEEGVHVPTPEGASVRPAASVPSAAEIVAVVERISELRVSLTRLSDDLLVLSGEAPRSHEASQRLGPPADSRSSA